MIEIRKGKEPEKLKALRQSATEKGLSPSVAYEKLKGKLKSQIRQSLVNEQGGLCAYCMCRIPRFDAAPQIEPVIIEHMIPRRPIDGRDVGQGLDYHNLFAVCHGNRSPHGVRQFKDLTCDAHRGNIELRKVNPCNPESLKTIFYELDGKIGAGDTDVAFDLVDTLNLNCESSPLIAERKAALDSLISELGKVEEEELLSYCIAALSEFQTEVNPKTPYVGALIWYLQSMVDGLSNT